ncbi:MAG: TraR/DksA family transcriptional regulator [Bacteroidota bacterium]|jgi:RNA polymerase-binding transcription factor DksA|uniref:TraR/DksA family transcriptional regulator n=1 Tax=Candidatus Pollutiaquabacter sp. TaxID=3416354 RepID=UPI001A50ED16|nr:TraR/DksA family transcriptional regulator [Bacteroidota bacterium]MBL7949371.1 TraR/DksA family transcriptional regulator [Bacteroidia bacterium]MBP7268858.1 TraR/DksA family transcriptional regulator [Bacteroidia bacterium]MBP7728676.1 TraR/DksA family transcriptional regulator [Bacteroidia bacterium]MBP7772786.1 TraR/DksA family transcriptional regulator [Bacteroidia bacterium]
MSKKTSPKKAKPAAKAKAKPAAKKPAAKKPAAKAKPKAKPAPKKPAAKKPVAKKVAPKAAPKKVAKPAAKAAKKVVVAKAPVKPAVVAKPKPAPAPAKPAASAPRPAAPAPTYKAANPAPKPIPPISKTPLARTATPAKEEDPGKTRYSDKELEEFRQIIVKKLEEARHELNVLQAQLTAANEHGTDDTASTFKMLEDGSESLAKEEAGQLAGRQKKFIEQLENALIRIENKTYGICRVTGKLIPKERLRAVPHTTQSIEAKLNQYRD